MDTIKAEQTGSAKWRVLAIPFGGPFKGGTDLDGEFFSPRPDIKARWFKERPVIFQHGQDAATGDEDYGVEEMDDAAIQGCLDLNLTSVIRACRVIVPQMKRQGGGLIINVTSACAKFAWPTWSVYSAAKTGGKGRGR